jgi:hypothetical protein
MPKQSSKALIDRPSSEPADLLANDGCHERFERVNGLIGRLKGSTGEVMEERGEAGVVGLEMGDCGREGEGQGRG